MFKYNTKEEKMLPLSEEELNALKPLYINRICPKKCHTSEKRIWFIPDVLVDSGSYEYTCCINCYYNKSNMNLLDGKYARENLVPLLCSSINMNCDESYDNNLVSEKIHEKLEFSIYQTSPNNTFLKLEKNGIDNYNIYCDDLNGRFSFVLTKSVKDEKNDSVLLAKISLENELSNNSSSALFTKSFPFSNELTLSLDKLTDIKETYGKKILLHKPLTYNFYNSNINTFYLEYSLKEDLTTIYKLKINFIYTKNKYVNNYNNYYKDSELSI
jgi:hypothetical protein